MSTFARPEWDLNFIIDALDQDGFCLLDDVYAADFFQAVRNECLAQLDQFKQAAVQNGVVSSIRSDHILWINQDLPTAEQHRQRLLDLGQQLNRTFFFGIKEVEAHFACYNAGEFYALHRDNPQQKNHRVLSSVFYLHEQWQAGWGGQLRLQDKHGNWHIIEPRPNRLALFQSDLLHEVLAAKQQRLSITAWLRSSSEALNW
ncbi:2OG-Fe(II) oxygenase [Acinetobacter sp. MD2(2019)]|uniref:2OG-Fe(II) oxygenase n=1 Tax=Acinetobacter sp. MD2(2019) TaxID=2605273 RepID=UPI002D1ECC56|nr:2OG-Fe(II) oxygenase [Acinetobacter sp. MD2(2019)]MEB3752983.1 2OG-Fe(II) oxygenase [Acinetobacter sp. MD2(2019)]